MRDPRTAIGTDLPTDEDLLGFAPYRDTLAEVVRTGETPLTVGLFGAWGSGKSSLLLMLQKALQADGREPGAEIVWFNAWQYSQREALWRALLSRVLEALRPKVGPTSSKVTLGIDGELDDLQASLYRMVEREDAGGFEVDWAKLAKGTLAGSLKVGLSFVPGGGLVKQLQAMADKRAESSLGDLLDAFRREKTKVRLEQVQFLEQFRHRFQWLVERRISKKGKRLVVLIDDLDRCMPETAIEVLEAVKLFLDVPGCVFVVAVDRKVIVEGIRVRYRDFALARDGGARLPIKGEDFLEKIIQVPFNLPPVRQEDMARFIAEQVKDLPQHCADVLSLGIEANPRKIKRVLNVFWMHGRLAEHRAELRDIIRPVRLAKVVVIQEVFPELYADWVEAPLLLRHLEEHFLTAERPEPQSIPEESGAEEGRAPVPAEVRAPKGPKMDLVAKWAQQGRLRRMLLCHAGEPGMGFSGLEQKELEDYLYLTRTSAAAAAEEERPPLDERLWEALRSGDRTRVESAVGSIAQEERKEFRDRLLAAMTSDREPPRVRASAGMAVGLLGDPRPGVGLRPDGVPDIAWCEVEAGPFLMGSPKDEAPSNETPQFTCTLIREPYRISRYPVTVAQYQAFVGAGGYDEKRHWTEAGWAWKRDRRVSNTSGPPFDPPNHPVVVVWHEAVAFCRWLSERLEHPVSLPTEAQWERAARHTDGRTYPWGNDGAPAERCNMADTGIGATTAVGVFPAGDSTCGVADLAGNVWEWCSTRWRDSYEGYEQKADDGLDGTDGRVLRGGSFSSGSGDVRCASRLGLLPDFRDRDFGFRVVASPRS